MKKSIFTRIGHFVCNAVSKKAKNNKSYNPAQRSSQYLSRDMTQFYSVSYLFSVVHLLPAFLKELVNNFRVIFWKRPCFNESLTHQIMISELCKSITYLSLNCTVMFHSIFDNDFCYDFEFMLDDMKLR